MHINTVAYLVKQYHTMSRPPAAADVSRVGGGAGREVEGRGGL